MRTRSNTSATESNNSNNSSNGSNRTRRTAARAPNADLNPKPLPIATVQEASKFLTPSQQLFAFKQRRSSGPKSTSDASDTSDTFLASLMGVQQGEGGRLWRSWTQYGQHGMVLLYLIVMMRSDLLMDLPPLPPPALTDRHVLLTSIQLAYVIVCQGFFVMFLIVSASRMTSNHAMKKHVTSLVLYVNSVACLTYIYKLTYGVPQLSTMRGAAPVMFPLRLVEWFFTTPIIISLLSCHLKRTKANLAIKRAALLSDWFMIISGFFEQRYADPLGAIWLVASCVSFMVLMHNFSLLFKNVTSSLLYDVDRRTLRIVHHATIFVWSVFPIVRLSAVAGLIEQETEEILFTALDFGAKLIFTLSVLLINFTVFDNAVEVRLELVQDYLAREIHKKNVIDKAKLQALDSEYERKMLAYAEVEVWRNMREESLLNEGVPAAAVAALLDSTLAEYVALASGNINVYTAT